MDWNTIAHELKFSFSRPSGTREQLTHEKETRVKLQFDVHSSKGLTPEEKMVITQKFDHIISKKGILALNAARDRSQLANRKYVTERFQDMLTELFKPRVPWVKTKRPVSGNEGRLKAKHQEAAKKSARKRPEI